MDAVFDRLSKIQPGREAWRIKVRVVRLWLVPSFLQPDRSNSMEMVFVDEDGVKMHATVRRSLLYVFENRLAEGSVYKMCFFSVVPNTGSYRTTQHEYKLVFQLKTKVTVAESSVIPTYGLSLVNSDEVNKHRTDSEFLVDLIGLLTAVSAEREYVRDGKITKMIVIELTDHRGRVECALFGDYVDELNSLMSLTVGELPVVIIQFAKIKIFRGNAVLQNVMQTSRILFNAPVAEVVAFRDSLALHGVDADQPMGLIGDGAKASDEDEFLKMHPKKTIDELNKTEEDGTFVVCANVVALVEGLDWWYPACRCHRAVSPDSGLYYCGGCYRHVVQVNPRFRLNVEVSDGNESTVFAIFDSDVQALTKKSCVELVSHVKLAPSGAYPKELEAIIGKKLLFKVEKKTDVASCFDASYRVKRVCADETLIVLFQSEGLGFTPSKSVFEPAFPAVVSLDDGEDDVMSSQTTNFVSSIVISPPPNDGSGCSRHAEAGSAKRKLDDVFEGLEDLDVKIPLVKVKIEKD